MGRSDWLFAGSVAAGERAARIMSLLETAKMNALDPHAWLTDVVQRLPDWPKDRLNAYAPAVSPHALSDFPLCERPL